MTPNENADHSGLRDMPRDSEEVAKYYDEWAEDYDDTLAQWRYRAPQEVSARLREMLEPEAAILDAGCGTGLSGQALAGAGFTAIDGIDVSQRSLDVAARRGVYRSLRHVDMQHLPLPLEDDSYDGLACVGVMTYLEDSEATMREFCRIVRPGGAVVVTQRTDILEERDFRGVLEKLESDGVVADVSVSEPGPYLPENEEFSDEVQVHYICCRVRSGESGQ